MMHIKEIDNSPSKILLVTGRLAEGQVRAAAEGAQVLVADVDVAAFITPELLLSASPQGYDLILIPGAITADFQEAERALGTKIRLGPKHAADLKAVLRHLAKEKIELSRTIPACMLLERNMREGALDQVQQLEEEAHSQLRIRDIKIGGSSRMKVLAEIVDATRLHPAALTERVRYYEEQGADMIDLGLPLDARPEQVKAALQTARKATNLPVSIDTIKSDLILAGLEAGADMILSLNAANLPQVGKAVATAGTPAVIIPGPGGISLEENLLAALQMGILAIADPILEPPLQGLAPSLHRYQAFREDHPDIPLFFGIGNATELLDADTVGVNALLAALGAECGASILFTPEYSSKAVGSVEELARASRMMLLARQRLAPPKDLGLDLLILKEKRHLPEEAMPETVIEAKGGHNYQPDRCGSFRISISSQSILAQNSGTTIAGKNARDILNTLIEMGLVSRLDHAGYLGRELEKAEIALRLKRSYVQDEPLWSSEKR
ncbi:MAG: dihydropteroate synthase-like protein [Methanothrix sp.]|nr:dihydropteroate synthase-like protein [Methanothrix sp.]